MKRILSIITALTLATAAVPAVLPAAAEIITADEVKEMIYSTGLGAYPELWDKIITEQGIEEDVLNPETRTVKDVIDVNKSYNTFSVKHRYTKKDGLLPYYDKNGRYQAFGSEQDDDFQYDFYGYNNDGRGVNLLVFPENYYDKEDAGTVLYSGVSAWETEERIRFCEDYEAIAESINKSDIKDVEDIRIIALAVYGSGIYVRDKSGNEYAIPAETRTDIHAQELGREVLTLTQGEVMDFKKWFDTVAVFEKNMYDNPVIKPESYEEYDNGDEIRDTDTRAAYIGTESVFTDVSGDLASYVNELADLGVITGYGDATFRPENTITRGEAAAMIARMFRYEGSYSGEFIDVSKGDWYANDIAALAANGVINGRSDTEFAPYADIKYQEVMKILVYALGYGSYFYGHGDDAYPFMTTKKSGGAWSCRGAVKL